MSISKHIFEIYIDWLIDELVLSPKLDMWIISTILVLYPSPCPDIYPICLSVHHGATPVSDMLFLPKKSDIFEDAKPGHQTSSQYEQSSFGPTNSPKIFVKSLKSAHQTSSGSASADLRWKQENTEEEYLTPDQSNQDIDKQTI